MTLLKVHMGNRLLMVVMDSIGMTEVLRKNFINILFS